MHNIQNHFRDSLPLPRQPLTREGSDILQRMKAVNNSHIFSGDQVLAHKLKAVHPIELSHILQHLFAEMLENESIRDPRKDFERIVSMIPLEKLEGSSGVASALKEAQDKLKEAQFYLESTQGKVSPTLRTQLSRVFDVLIAVIEAIVSAFGVAGFFKPAENELEAEMRTNIIFRLIGLLTFVSTALLPIFGAAAGAKILGFILLGIAVLSLIWPHIRPAPRYLPANAVNLTQKVRLKPTGAYGRKESLDDIYRILKRNRHALLVGQSRVGKSLTMKAFAEAVERGDYPEFKGKQVFCINTTDLLDHKASMLGGGNNILNKISEKMGRHRDDIILVFDEIHMACKNNEKIADQFKTFLDEDGEFPHVIGITTLEELHFVRENNAFSQRFDEVRITSTSEDETLKILGDTVLKSPSLPVLGKDVLKRVYQRSDPNAPQPTAARKLLKRCINLTERTEQSPTEKRVIQVSNRILSLRTQSAASRGGENDFAREIERLERELQQLQEALKGEKKEIEKLFQVKALLDKTTKEGYQAVLKVSQTAKAKMNEKYLKQYLLLQKFFGEYLIEHLKAKSQNLGIKIVLDEALVDQVAAG